MDQVSPTPTWKQLGEDIQAFILIIGFYFAFGIIGLPATLVSCGPEPLVACAILVFVMEFATIVLQVDNMQRAQRALALMDPDSTARGWLPTPDLHTMGLLFLPKGVSVVWDIIVILAYSPSLIYFMLEGVGISATTLDVSPQIASVIFVAPCILVVSLMPSGRALFPSLTALTGVKFVLLCVCTVALGAMGSGSGVLPSTDWNAFLSPFLMVSYIVGGTSGCLPANITGRGLATRAGVARYLASVLAALTVFSALTIVWGVYVLGVVPQTEAGALERGFPPDCCSLQWAAKGGKLASIPLINVIQRSHASFYWVAPSVTAMLVGIWLCFSLTAICFNHAINGFAASLVHVASSFAVIEPVSSTELLQLLNCDEPSPWDATPQTKSAGGCWSRFLATWRSDRRFRLLLTSRGLLYTANGLVMFVTALAFPSTVFSDLLATLTTNIGGGVFPALLFIGARKHFLQQPAWMPDLQARRLTSGSEGQSPSDGAPRRGKSSTEDFQLALPRIPFALPESAGHANMAFVLISFALAGLYQIRSTTLRHTDAHWGTAVTGAYVVLCIYHLATELLGCLPALRTSAAASAAAVGLNSADQPLVDVADYVEDARASGGTDARLIPRATPSASHGGGRIPWLASFEASCELADIIIWILYGLLPREEHNWPLVAAAVLTAYHLVILLVSQLHPVFPALSALRSVGFQLFISIVDAAYLLCWAVVAFALYGSEASVAGALAVVCAILLIVELWLRRRWDLASAKPVLARNALLQ